MPTPNLKDAEKQSALEQEVKALQEAPYSMGTYPGPISGVFNDETHAAWAEFQRMSNIDPSDKAANEAAMRLLLSLPPVRHAASEPAGIPGNAESSLGDDWTCARGYYRSGDECFPVHVPENAALSLLGTAWVCNPGFKRVGNSCAPVAPRERITRPIAFPRGFSGGCSSRSYDVSGSGDDGDVTGTIDTGCGGDVSGTLETEDGEEVEFDGEWSGRGEVEGYDEDGNYYELEVD